MLKRFYDHCEPEYKFIVSDAAELVNEADWNSIARGNIYLDIPYLHAMEQGMTDFDYRYVIAYDKSLRPVLKAYFQIVDLKGLDKRYKSWMFQRFGEQRIKKVLPNFQMRILICGNLFVCGENGYVHSDLIEGHAASKLLGEAVNRVSKALDETGKTSLMLIKELFPENDPGMEAFKQEKYYPFQVDCNMILTLKQDWRTMDDYYGTMTSKFRTKAKGVMRKSQDLVMEEWSDEEIVNHAVIVDELHGQVLEKADFSLGELNANTFAAMKRSLGGQMIFRVYKLHGKIVGFAVAYVGDDFIDAAHVGIDYKFNLDYAIYQRMLHDFVQIGIADSKEEVRFGRTAEQMKSSLGAEPVYMRLYMRHRNGLVNHLLKPVIDRIKPNSFELRKPFKAEVKA